MKKSKIILILTLLFLLSPSIYKNHIYYLIPRNPIESINFEPLDLNLRETNDFDESYYRSNDLNNNIIILNYFKNLDLVPINNQTYRNEMYQHSNDNFFSYHFIFLPKNSQKYYRLRIKEIYLDNLSIMYISSNIKRFQNGYYKIRNSKFDYQYINELIKTQELQ